MSDDQRYRIVRMYSKDTPAHAVRGKRGLTLEEARAHCRDPKTRGTLPTGEQWFDGYEADAPTRKRRRKA